MFKYFALTLNCFLAILYEFNAPTISLMVLIPPILHTLVFYIKPHCYSMHCKPNPEGDRLHHQITTPNKLLHPLLNHQESPQQILPLSLSPSPSPTPFTPNTKTSPHLSVSPSVSASPSALPAPMPVVEYEQCRECGLRKWIRMHHCYYCEVCIHKYDHHCILLGLCIGQANQKYYIPLLWAFFAASIIQLQMYLSIIDQYLMVNENGYEIVQWGYVGISCLVIFFAVGVVVVGSLAIIHTYNGLYNNTSYQLGKRPEIPYLRGIHAKHPFHKGFVENIRQILMVNRNEPIEWERPQRERVQGLEVVEEQKQSKYMTLPEYHYINLNHIQL